ncbi:glycosyltransferase [Flavobacterium sp. Arc2]|uniref:glycosyltransferase n=1 Tax=Flavobacterium sp. Arc2 TaxID=3046685 RepID=UPI00352F4386
MKLLVVSTAPFIYNDDSVYAYSPYVEELVLWNKYTDSIAFCCPVWANSKGLLISPLPFSFERHFRLVDFNLKTTLACSKAFFFLFYNFTVLFKAMLWADHIHLRCPGNIGLLGCIVQIFFPSKPKTAKYAGNWDPKAKQPWTYKLQQKILQNTFLTRNMQVLIYGAWEGQTGNCKSFFTASYYEIEKQDLVVRNLESKINFIFVGALVKGKNPLYAIQLVEGLLNRGFNVGLNLYGEGVERTNLEVYITKNNLTEIISLKGNQDKATLKKAYQQSHFVVLPSKSEGWPKAIAEGMFWGCVPIATPVSCVPWMLDYENRGVVLNMDLNVDVLKIADVLQKNSDYKLKQKNAFDWSRQYTLDVFETEIKKLIV